MPKKRKIKKKISALLAISPRLVFMNKVEVVKSNVRKANMKSPGIASVVFGSTK